jgi:5,10-methenyltetrahydromethanopterin hydrogenase
MTQALIDLLRRREAVIADHPWRDRDPAAHLDALKQVSEQISAWTEANQTTISPKLRHYLANSSFQKALDHLNPPPRV